jgi:hypothetical protein
MMEIDLALYAGRAVIPDELLDGPARVLELAGRRLASASNAA